MRFRFLAVALAGLLLSAAPPHRWVRPVDRSRWRVGNINVIGNTETPRSFIEAQLPFRTGDVFTLADLRTAEANLARTHFFRVDPVNEVRPMLRARELPGYAEFYDIDVYIEELPGNDLVFSTWEAACIPFEDLEPEEIGQRLGCLQEAVGMRWLARHVYDACDTPVDGVHAALWAFGVSFALLER